MYNGWKNYETWAVKLWMDNEEDSYHYWRERAEETKDNYSLSEELKDWMEENFPITTNNIYSDLLSAAISEIDWYEISEALLDEVKETA